MTSYTRYSKQDATLFLERERHVKVKKQHHKHTRGKYKHLSTFRIENTVLYNYDVQSVGN